MNARERVHAAIDFKTPDQTAVQYFYTNVGYYEHGDKLNDLFEKHEGDFEPYQRRAIPKLPPEVFDPDGNYYERKTDAWGTVWEYRIYGIAGHTCEYPLNDWEQLGRYRFPALPAYVTDASAFQAELARIRKHQESHFYKVSVGGFFERLIELRNFNDVLCDMYNMEEPLIRLLDRLTDYYEQHIAALILLGVDAITFGDDYGTQENLIFSQDLFRELFKPRYKRLIETAKKAGVCVHFHSCGKVGALFEDFKDMGVDSIWPQLPAYNMQELAYTCRDLKLALAIHTDRAYTMTSGTPSDVKALVEKEFEIFRPDKGGSWFYIEADNGFPYENMEALVKQVYTHRNILAMR